MARRRFGNIRKLPSGRYQARYAGPDGKTYRAPNTFGQLRQAERWLERTSLAIDDGTWVAPGQAPPEPTGPGTFGAYAEEWLATRTTRGRRLKPQTRALYRHVLDKSILPTFEGVPLDALTPPLVRAWYATLPEDKPTARAHAYSLLRTILTTAEDDGAIESNPCRIKGAGTASRKREIRPATRAEVEDIAARMPDRFKAAVLLTAFCGLRFGELVALRRGDLLLEADPPLVRIERAATVAGGVGTTKTDAARLVHIPPHLAPILTAHLEQHVGDDDDALVFPAKSGGILAGSSLWAPYRRARTAAGRPDLRWHDLRHTAARWAMDAGATMADTMARLGHRTYQAAMIYQHASPAADADLARKLSGGEKA